MNRALRQVMDEVEALTDPIAAIDMLMAISPAKTGLTGCDEAPIARDLAVESGNKKGGSLLLLFSLRRSDFSGTRALQERMSAAAGAGADEGTEVQVRGRSLIPPLLFAARKCAHFLSLFSSFPSLPST